MSDVSWDELPLPAKLGSNERRSPFQVVKADLSALVVHDVLFALPHAQSLIQERQRLVNLLRGAFGACEPRFTR